MLPVAKERRGASEMVNDLRDFLALLERRGVLRRITAEVDPLLEIAAITDRVCKRPGGGPALFFAAVRGHGVPVLTNLFGSAQRMAWALGTEKLEDLAARLTHELALAGDGAAAQRLQRIAADRRWRSVLRETAPCRQRESAGGFDSLPALQGWPGDGGRFLTLPLVFTCDAETGRSNCGMYRMQIFDARTAALHWGEGSDGARHARSWAAHGERMPVAVALGGDPALIYAAAAPLPPEVAESAFAGWLRGKPLEMVACDSGDLQVPASAEFVLEGYVEPGEVRPEGPFGNHTGFYAPPSPAPVFHLTRLTSRRDPLYPCTVVGPPPMENLSFAAATEILFLPLLQIDFPEVCGWHFIREGAFHGCCLLALRPEAAGQGLALIRRLWETPLFSRSRLLITVDAGLDLHAGDTLLWRLINQIDPGRDLIVSAGRLGVDGTEKTGLPRLSADPATERLVAERWGDYGID